MNNLCAPAIIYLIFSITQILIDTFKGLYNTAFMKGIVTVMITLLLNILCERGLGVVSWIIVFIPFILMTVIVSMLLYVFGLDAATGSLNHTCGNRRVSSKNRGDGIKVDALGNIVVYDPEYNSTKNPVYYSSPNIIIPNPHKNDKSIFVNNNQTFFPNSRSSPAYQS